MMISEKIGCIVTMLMALLVLSCTSEDALSDAAASRTVPVSLAMNISTSRFSTRMTAAMTQQEGQGFRGINDLYLFPFLCEKPIGSEESLSSPVNALVQRYQETLNYFDESRLEIPLGTRSFLCYAKAVPEEDKFQNGFLTATIPSDVTDKNTGDISFSPKVIHDGNAVETALSYIAAYLTSIANAHPDEETANTWSVFSQSEAQEFPESLTKLRSLFRQFVNEGHPIACSSVYAEKWVNWLYTELQKLGDSDMRTAILTALTNNALVTFTDGYITLNEDLRGYPDDIYLPEGAAVVKWDNANHQFVPQTATTTEVNINNLNRFVYPAELYYYANSAIKTSSQSQKEHYSQTWTNVLSNYENDNAVMTGTESSIAIKDPLKYAVGCLQVGLNVSNIELEDAAEPGKTITLKDGKTEGENASFPLTAILVSSQFAQGYDFTPKGEADEYIIYDKNIEGSISMGAPNTPASSTKYTNTLVLQTKDDKRVSFALEFTNNSGVDFQGINGMVLDGTKFYLVGTIEVPVDKDQDYKKRVFTKNYITKGVVRISSLKEAYTYLPDLLDPRLEVGIQLVPDWIQVTTTNVPL